VNLSPLSRIAVNAESVALMLLPHGGQRSARKNAWASMSEGSARARGRREADAAMARAVAMSLHPAASAR
jgi:hypothetical protein